jgi:hypothetical protein
MDSPFSFKSFIDLTNSALNHDGDFNVLDSIFYRDKKKS